MLDWSGNMPTCTGFVMSAGLPSGREIGLVLSRGDTGSAAKANVAMAVTVSADVGSTHAHDVSGTATLPVHQK